MSLKGVELQIAIPKTVEAGKIADQQQQRAQIMQDQANEQALRQFEKNRSIVHESHETDRLLDGREQRKDQEQQQSEQQKKQQRHTQKKEAIHPYKGSIVDYSG
ncbi:MAG TPA: RNA polymerase subunit sigma [Sporosarcina sp.]|nr:RNA polymerase subunit sigma [Sporosarcina sp.]